MVQLIGTTSLDKKNDANRTKGEHSCSMVNILFAFFGAKHQPAFRNFSTLAAFRPDFFRRPKPITISQA